MSNVIPISPSATPLKLAKSHNLPSDNFGVSISLNNYYYISNSSLFRSTVSLVPTYSNKIHVVGGGGGGGGHVKAFSQGSVQALDSLPASVDLEPILSESQFYRVIADAQQIEESLVIVWMAKWCRKCIYLKPKLEKLAADYYPRVRFYCIDVNNVPHKLVVRAGITKMPTIQLWKDSKKQAEVIGGHKAYLVVNEVREMIENESTV